MYQIFISYSSADSGLASELKTHFENAFEGKITCFVSAEDIGPGDYWKDAIKQSINAFERYIRDESLFTTSMASKV